MKEPLVLTIIITILSVCKCETECYRCIEGERGTIQMPACSPFSLNPEKTCRENSFCVKIVTFYKSGKTIVRRDCLETSLSDNGVKKYYRLFGVFNGRIKYHKSDDIYVERYTCDTSLCNSASLFTWKGSLFTLFLIYKIL